MNVFRTTVPVLLLAALASCAQSAGPDAPAGSDGSGQPDRSLAEGVTGRITNDQGVAVAGAMIVPRSLDDAGPPIPEIAIVSDENGRYEWPLRPGRYELAFLADGYERAARQVVVTSGAVATLDVRLERDR